LVRDSVPVDAAVGDGIQRFVGDTLVTCSASAAYCYFYRSGTVASTSPAVLDVDLNVFGFGVEGLRAYVSTRFRTDFGADEFWPRVNDNFDLLAGYVELNRPRYRLRVGRDYEVSGLGFYGYDGGSALFRIPTGRIELEAYGGWGLERGVPEPINSDAFASLGRFQPQERNYLFGFRGSARPATAASLEVIYQREIPTDRAGIASERVAFEAVYRPRPGLSFQGHADYDIAAGWWGKAGLKAGWRATPRVYVEGGYLRYRPVFSLQTIWLAFSPVAYDGWNVSVALGPVRDVSLRLWAERRAYDETDAEVPFFRVTDRDWRVGGRFSWRPGRYWGAEWKVDGGYWIDWGFGATLSSGDVRIGMTPTERVSVGLRFSAFQQLEEFRIAEGRIWGIGGDVRWRTPAGTVWFAVDSYDHNRRGDAGLTDWTQWRGAFGFSYYVGSEPGRVP
jgi:hypothetical protein